MENFYYAQLDENDICFTVIDNGSELQTSDKIIPLKSYDLSLLGKRYNNGVWENVEQPESEAEPEITQLDRIEAILNEDKNEIIETAIDEYTLELIEQGVL